MRTFVVLLAVVATASAHGNWGWDSYARPAYSSSYSVSDKHTGDQKSATETRDGDVTKGSYSLVQPDGVVRTVNYISTPHGGFQAQVHNSGAAHHAPAVKAVVAAPVVAVPVWGNAWNYGWGNAGWGGWGNAGWGGWNNAGWGNAGWRNAGWGGWGNNWGNHWGNRWGGWGNNWASRWGGWGNNWNAHGWGW